MREDVNPFICEKAKIYKISIGIGQPLQSIWRGYIEERQRAVKLEFHTDLNIEPKSFK